MRKEQERYQMRKPLVLRLLFWICDWRLCASSNFRNGRRCVDVGVEAEGAREMLRKGNDKCMRTFFLRVGKKSGPFDRLV
jgi:hypothetical protein